MPSPDQKLKDSVLAKLASAGASGLSASKLTRKRNVLASLLSEGQIVNLGTAAKPYYVLPEYNQPLELAAQHILSKARPGEATAYSLAKFQDRKLPEKVRQCVRPAAESLCQQRLLIKIGIGRSDYWIHAASILPLMKEAACPPNPSKPAPPSLSLYDAYQQAKRSEGFSDVLISHLHSASHLPLAELHLSLRQLSASGHAVLSLGDWSLASEQERAAALHLDGRPYLRVRLLS